MSLYTVDKTKAKIWKGEKLNGISYPLNIEKLWSTGELEAIGLYRADPPAPVPEGKQSKGETLKVVDGKPVRETILEDIPIEQVRAAASITLFQARVSLVDLELDVDIKKVVNTLGHPADLYYDFAEVWRRNDPIIVGILSETTMPDKNKMGPTDIDDFFNYAAKVSM